MEKLSIEDLTKLTISVGEISSLTWNIFEDGAVNFKDIDEVWGIMRNAQCLMSLSVENLKLEFFDLDEEERQYLIGKFKEKFDIANDEIENAIEKIIDIICDIYNMVIKIRSVF